MSLTEQLQLKEGETLCVDSSRQTGPLANIDITNYSVLDAQGNVIGKVEYTEDMAIKGFKVTHKAVRTDLDGKTVLQKFW